MSGPGVPGDPRRTARPAAPVRQRMWDGGSAWVVTRHHDVAAVLTDPRFVTNTASLPGGGPDSHADLLVKVGVSADLAPYLAGNLTHVDAPEHTRLRRLVSEAFTAERVAALRPRVAALAGTLLDALPGHATDGTVDLVEHFARPLPIAVLCELLGIPERDRPRWRGWSRDCAGTSPRTLNTALGELAAAVRELAGRRRTDPRDDLLTGLVQTRDESGGRLDDAELVTMVLTLLVAGHETTAHLIANGTAALLAHPEQLALLRADPGLIPGAVQELLRLYGPPTATQPRYATEDIAVGGVDIPRGDCVHAQLAAANRDPAHYPRPDALDITRAPRTPHLAYSLGPHRCLGAGLADQQAETALAALFGRFPGLTLAVPPERFSWQPSPVMLHLTRLPVRLGRTA
ncbi:cytochrome P450 [Streptomyces sparsogenes]|uniref:cytochrome P450 family protein n=1 Tax=Streptomyces sparsogenes TaxID=67365 RepID=UPI00340046C0